MKISLDTINEAFKCLEGKCKLPSDKKVKDYIQCVILRTDIIIKQMDIFQPKNITPFSNWAFKAKPKRGDSNAFAVSPDGRIKKWVPASEEVIEKYKELVKEILIQSDINKWRAGIPTSQEVDIVIEEKTMKETITLFNEQKLSPPKRRRKV